MTSSSAAVFMPMRFNRFTYFRPGRISCCTRKDRRNLYSEPSLTDTPVFFKWSLPARVSRWKTWSGAGELKTTRNSVTTNFSRVRRVAPVALGGRAEQLRLIPLQRLVRVVLLQDRIHIIRAPRRVGLVPRRRGVELGHAAACVEKWVRSS